MNEKLAFIGIKTMFLELVNISFEHNNYMSYARNYIFGVRNSYSYEKKHIILSLIIQYLVSVFSGTRKMVDAFLSNIIIVYFL